MTGPEAAVFPKVSGPKVSGRSSPASPNPRHAGRPRTKAYARFVRLLRVLLPTAAALLIVLVVLWPQLAPRDDQFRIGFADVEISDSGLSMIRPRYIGTDQHDRPFSITARSVRNLTPDGEEMLLDEPEAEMTLADGTWVTVTADTGTYEVEQQAVRLSGVVRLFHDQGYELQTSAARIDLNASEVTGDRPVEGHGPAGYLEGSGFRIGEDGGTIDVLGPARMIINPSAQVRR